MIFFSFLFCNFQNRCTMQLDAESDSAIYCFATDGNSTMLTGHANYNSVCFWDTRFGRYPIKVRQFIFHSSFDCHTNRATEEHLNARNSIPILT